MSVVIYSQKSADAVRSLKKKKKTATFLKTQEIHLQTDSKLKLTISNLPVLKMYTTINVIALANLKKTAGGKKFCLSSISYCHHKSFYIKQSKKLEVLSLKRSVPRNPVHVQILCPNG